MRRSITTPASFLALALACGLEGCTCVSIPKQVEEQGPQDVPSDVSDQKDPGGKPDIPKIDGKDPGITPPDEDEAPGLPDQEIQTDQGYPDGCVPKCWTTVCGPDQCGGLCGVCPPGTVCSKDQSMCISTSVQKPLGGRCGQNGQCAPFVEDPYKRGSRFPNPDWPDCLDDQCLEGPCVAGFCSRKCKVHKDTVQNGGNLPVDDGIEDPDTPDTDCSGAVADLFQGVFACIETDVAGGKGQCFPKSSFAPCKGTSSCPQGESCGFIVVRGNSEPHCLANPKGATGIAQSCVFDPITGLTPVCSALNCSDSGCTEACDADAECLTAGAKCKGDKCAGTDFPCAVDADCSAWACGKGVALPWPQGLFDACTPRQCKSDSDCRDPGFFCRHSFEEAQAKEGMSGGAMAVAGRCAPRLAGGGPLSAPCDEDKGDEDPDVVCQDHGYCIDHRCSAMCASDADCAGEGVPEGAMRCGAMEFPADTDGNGEPDLYIPVPMCIWIGGSGEPCETQQGCTSGNCTPWLAQQPDGALDVSMTCMEPPAGSVGIGYRCGVVAFGVECDTRTCLLDDPGDNVAGWCSKPCLTSGDCPGPTPVGPVVVKWLCEAHRFATAGTPDPADDLNVAWCTPYPAESSFGSCEATLACENGEVCHASVRAGSPGGATNVDEVCIEPSGTAPPGSPCDPGQDWAKCASGFCAPTALPSVGFCSTLCTWDSDCFGLGWGAATCDPYLAVVGADCPDGVAVPWCRIRAECVVCRDDRDCGTGFRCVNAGEAMGMTDFRCALGCATDADCMAVGPDKLCSEAASPYDPLPAGKVKACLPLVCGGEEQ